ncbi:MAG: tRNA-dihydrouridine synthase family protein [Clostridia bacterium]|nr:tRNA-dihydrouridine synthase family protein [Clostridia bacterium]
MKVKSLAIGSYQSDNNIFLAPMAGYTDYPFREVALKTGYGLSFTELVSAKGLLYGGRANDELVFCGQDKKRTAIQIFGSDPYSMRCACESEYLKDCQVVDINMGCPVPKVFKNGDGSALLTNVKKASEIIKECVKSGKNITVKIRTGLKKGDDVAREYAVMAEDSGAKLITIHGRVREAYYSGEVDFEAIKKAKESVKIPVIANGGVFTTADADELMEKTGADGVMIGRGALGDPFICAKLLGKQPDFTLKEFILQHIDNLRSFYPERRGILEFRKFVSYYFRGAPNVKDVKMQLFSSEDFDKTKEIISTFLTK